MNKKILITGFEPFGKNEFNPSKEVLEPLSYRGIDTLLLPVSFEKAFFVLQKYLNVNVHYTHLIHLGIASDRDFISIEKIAINYKNAAIPDNDGIKPIAEKIQNSKTAPDGVFTRISTKFFLDCSKQFDLNGYISFHAGTYVCNDLLYKSLTNYPELKITFIHVPKAEKLAIDKLEDFLIYFTQNL